MRLVTLVQAGLQVKRAEAVAEALMEVFLQELAPQGMFFLVALGAEDAITKVVAQQLLQRCTELVVEVEVPEV
jgi:hypothetical protein